MISQSWISPTVVKTPRPLTRFARNSRTDGKHHKLHHDLEKRIFLFVKSVRLFTRRLNLTITNIEDAERLLRCSGSVGTRYLEAGLALTKKDHLSVVRLCKKETKESAYWLKLIGEVNGNRVKKESNKLCREAILLSKVFSLLLKKSATTKESGKPSVK